MKRIIVALIIFISAFFISVIFENIAEEELSKTIKMLYECAEKEENEYIASEKLKKTVLFWNDKKKIFFMTTNCEDYSAVENNMAILEYIVKKYNFEEASVLCRNTAVILEKKKEEYKISFENVF